MDSYGINPSNSDTSFSAVLTVPSSIQHHIESVKNYIHDHLQEPLNLATLASSGGFSIYYFARRFKQYTGLSPKQYVLRKRLELAYELLCQGKTTVSDVAYQTGFTDQSHLVRYFKKCWGQTPKEVLESESALALLTRISLTKTQQNTVLAAGQTSLHVIPFQN
jgi:AraC-like DNA-binding protein